MGYYDMRGCPDFIEDYQPSVIDRILAIFSKIKEMI